MLLSFNINVLNIFLLNSCIWQTGIKIVFIPINPRMTVFSPNHCVLKTHRSEVFLKLSNLLISIFDTCILNLSTETAHHNLFTSPNNQHKSCRIITNILENSEQLYSIWRPFSKTRSDSATFVRGKPETLL